LFWTALFPIYIVDNDLFENKLVFSKDFPQILYVVNGIIISAFKPIPLEDEFSDIYYKHLSKMLEGD